MYWCVIIVEGFRSSGRLRIIWVSGDSVCCNSDLRLLQWNVPTRDAEFFVRIQFSRHRAGDFPAQHALRLEYGIMIR